MTKFLNTLSVYLSGPITHVDPSWRLDVAEELERIGREVSFCVQVYIPEESKELNAQSIKQRDLRAIEKLDIVICYIFAETFGSSMEIFYSYHDLRKPTFVICPYRNISPWLTANSTKLYKSLKGFYRFFSNYLKEQYPKEVD